MLVAPSIGAEGDCATTTQRTDELSGLRNIGPAMRADFSLLSIGTVAELAARDADTLYLELGAITGTRPDPCVHDTFAAAIHQARTGEALPWWAFTAARKQRQKQGTFVQPGLPSGRISRTL